MSKSTKKKPITKGGLAIRHAQSSAAHVRKNVITLPRISLEKKPSA